VVWIGALAGALAVSLSAASFASTGPADNERVLDFRVIHRQTKEPLADVALQIQINAEDRERQKSWEDKTDSQGRCRIRLPDFQIRTLRVYPQKEGFVSLRVFWQGDPTPPEIPKTFTVAMEPGTTIGGIVQNEQGEPIEAVTVSVYYHKDDPEAAENARVNIALDKVKTDKAGRWQFDRMPAQIDKNELRIFLQHPDYLSDNLVPGFIPMPLAQQPTITDLQDLSSVMVMKMGAPVTGRVIDKQGNPIAGARIYEGDTYWYRSKEPFAKTDSQGNFRSNPTNTKPGRTTLTVQASGYAPDLKVVTIKPGLALLEFRLGPGRVIQGKVVDQAGKPIAGAFINARTWREQRHRLNLQAKTDADGSFKITDAPNDEVSFDIDKQGYMMRENYPMEPGKGEYTITLRPLLKVHGKVLDAKTGKPIDKFTVTNGFDHEDGRAPQWDTFTVRTFTGGQYEFEYMQEIFTYRLRIDAEGYQSAMSDCIRPSEISESQVVLDFKLDKAAAVEGVVLSPDGTPLSKAEVVIATHWVRIQNGQVDSRSSEYNRILRTGSAGKFRFDPPVEPYLIIVLHEQGYAEVTPPEFAASPRITVSAWGRVEGTLRIGAKPGVHQSIALLPEYRSEAEHPRITFEYETQTDENGRFVFARALPGEGAVSRSIPMNGGRRFGHTVAVQIKAGQTTRVQIGGTGRPVIGKVVIPDAIKGKFDWQYTDCSLSINSAENPYKLLHPTFEEDGSFRVEDVPVGDYCLYIHAYEPAPDSQVGRAERIGFLSYPFRVGQMPDGRSDEPLDLGVLEMEPVGLSVPASLLTGKALPTFDDLGVDFTAEQVKSKPILICFWDMNQRPSRNCIRRLAEQAEQLKQKGITVVAVHISKVDESKLDEWVKNTNITFPVGRVRSDEEKIRFKWGVRSLPWLILTDPKHVVTAEGFAVSEMGEKLE
jgi:hypothetical protein